MTNKNMDLINQLIEQICIDNHPVTLDDNYADMIGESWQESIQELIDYLEELK